MEDGVASNECISEKMGATNNSNSARLVILQERKKQIEETLLKRNQELRQLCIQEAELTGITPPEMPLEAGETPPTIRRHIGTAFQLNENLLNNSSKDQLIADLELQIQVHMNLADAAMGLANEASMSKTVKRQHRAEYQKHKIQVNALSEKLLMLKERAASEQIKQKKKSRIPEPQDDGLSIITNEPYSKPENRHSQLSKHCLSMLSPTDTYPEARYPAGISRQPYRNSENPYYHYTKPDELLTSGFYRLSLNGFNEYIDRHENINSMPHYNYPSQTLPYNYPYSSHTRSMHGGQHSQQDSPHMSQNSPQISQHSPLLSQNSSHISQHSPHLSQHSPHLSQPSPLSQHSQMSQHSPLTQSHSSQVSHSPLSQHSIMQRASQNYSSRISQQYILQTIPMHRQSSPTTGNPVNNVGKVQYYPSYTIHGEPGYNRYTIDTTGFKNTMDGSVFRNPHPIQPHQQYEHNGMNSGLGGCWKRSENGDMFWIYSSSTLDSNWQIDKRFGSLDRRKNKRIQRRVSPIENKSATLSALPNHSDPVKTAFVKPPQVTRFQDHGQLVRTQSLGSVGQTIDSVYPSDDNSSCESDNRSLKGRAMRKPKEKEWLETSLDGPLSPTHSAISCSQSTVPTILAPEEKYVIHTPPPSQLSPNLSQNMQNLPLNLNQSTLQHMLQNLLPQISSPLGPKSRLEIPAESHPSPRVPDLPNMELLNNNIPKNCTLVQAGVCKPYHEETKPFEMSDFYKYSTKFKKSPQKETGERVALSQAPGGTGSQKNLNESFKEMENKNRYAAIQSQSIKIQQYQHSTNRESNTCNLNTSLDISHITVAEHFSEEMNIWYNDQEHRNDNNNSTASKSRSTATLV